jgi:RNA polymerase sigma factor (sigma-70 family)
MGHLTESAEAPDHANHYIERVVLARDIAQLPRKQRAVVILRYYEDLPDDEIAELLGCATSTVRVHALRALRALRIQRNDTATSPDNRAPAGRNP